MIEIELKKKKKNYGLNNVLDGVSFEVKTCERIALIGENGAGKSTLLNIIASIEKPDFGTISIRRGASIGYLKQIYEDDVLNPTVQEFLSTSFKEFFDLENKMNELELEMENNSNPAILNKYGNLQDLYISMGGYDLKEKFSKICGGFNFSKDFLNQKYNNLSGGEKTMVNLASILLKEPSILLLDEPTNHLDINALEWLENFLINYKGSILMVSHDRYFLDKVATKTILLENGKSKIYFGNYSYFLEEDERRTLAEFENYKSQQKQIEKMKESIKTLRKFGNLAKNEMFFKRAKSIEKKLAKMEVLDKVVLEEKPINLQFKTENRSGKDVLRVELLNKSFDDKTIFNDISFDIFYGERVCLMGKNGSGKTTLIKMILDLDKDYTGTIKLGSSVNIGYIPQIIEFSENETILDFFLKSFNGSETQARTYLAKYRFRQNDVFKKVSSLSGGEKVRIKLLELMQKDVNFLIFDEPTNYIDISTREVLEETLQNFNGTVLFISHDRYFINKLATRILTIKNNNIYSYVGNYDKFLNI